MTVEYKMPQMGESLTEGTIVKWLRKPGDRIERDDPLLEISTDKVDTVLPAPAAGFLAEILVPEGDTVPVDTLLCTLSKDPLSEDAVGAASPAGDARAESSANAAPVSSPPASDPGQAETLPSSPSPVPGPQGPRPVARGGSKTWLSPAVRRLLREHDASADHLLAEVRGSGKSGRVTRQDAEAWLTNRSADGGVSAAASPLAGSLGGSTSTAGPISSRASTPWPDPLEDRREPVSHIRHKIAEHMLASRRTSAHVSTVHEVDISNTRALRDELRRSWYERGVKLTYLPFVIQAIARGLRHHPILNSTFDGAEIRYKGGVHIGIAVAIEKGLIVPVLRDADRKSVWQIAEEIGDLADRARRKALRPDEVQGGTFTLTNVGVFGTLIGTPIINQPQVGILCMGAVQKRVVVLPGTDTMAIRSMCYMSMSFDHRLIDGAEADRFLARMKSYLETCDFRLGDESLREEREQREGKGGRS